MDLLTNIGIIEAVLFSFTDVVDDARLSEGGSIYKYIFMIVLEDDNLSHVCRKYLGVYLICKILVGTIIIIEQTLYRTNPLIKQELPTFCINL